ncbi:hypothetical protein L1987_42329 [Smallanthus sonchifolius]|uniref:Uncharacterized protein n=1 Tax=Smallanthus sonchifolius TaxID=185202 RepID=A0ACB9GJA7_9ASTR|nr:hypothetical protein L1987_42329 [Smallanthus sonchifolius]
MPFLQVSISRGLNSIGLAIVGPDIQSLVADSTNDEDRGGHGLVPVVCVVICTNVVGFSHKNTAFLIFLFVIGNSVGGLFSGRAGDVLSKRFPSSASAIPLGLLLLLALKDDPSTLVSHAIVLFIMGFFISWNGPATNNPIFAEIVPEKSRTSVYALDRSFESILSSFAPPIVGTLAQHVYGYIPIEKGSENIATDRDNATSLAKALYVSIGVPMALCCFIYSFLYRTYSRDREQAQMEALIEAEMETMGSGPMDGRPRMAFDGDINEGLDESDEKMLLYRRLTFANMVV